MFDALLQFVQVGHKLLTRFKYLLARLSQVFYVVPSRPVRIRLRRLAGMFILLFHIHVILDGVEEYTRKLAIAAPLNCRLLKLH